MTIVIPVTITNEKERTWAKEIIYQALQESEDSILVIDHGSTYLKDGVDHQRIEWKGPQTRITQVYYPEVQKELPYPSGEYMIVDPATSGVPVG